MRRWTTTNDRGWKVRFLLVAWMGLGGACGEGASGDSPPVPDTADLQDADRDDVEPREDVVDVDARDAAGEEGDVAADGVDAGGGGPTGARFEAWCGPAASTVEARIDAAIAAMTLDEKASLMHGRFALPRDGAWQSTALPTHGIPGFRMLDGPRGVSRFSGRRGTAFPVAMARGASWNVELEASVGRMIAAELRVVGADVLLAPAVNLLRHPRWGRAQETYGEDPHLLGRMGAAFVRGAQRHTMAVVKHYAANSIEDTRLEVDVRLGERALREVYLPHFRHIVTTEGVAGVMTSYNRVNGEYASQNATLVDEILRGEWGFYGFTVSDFLWGTHDTVPALEAGLDVEMPIARVYGRRAVDAMRAGEADEALVDAAVRRILRTQWCFAERLEAPTLEATEGPDALALAEESAAQGMVLLRNEAGALPIRRDAEVELVVVGALADESNTGDRGSSHVESNVRTTPLQGLRDAAGAATVLHVEGDVFDEDAVEAMARASAVIVVVGYTEDDEGEGQVASGDRERMTLREDDVRLIRDVAERAERVVVVLVGGSAIEMEAWVDDVEAVVMGWYMGSMGGPALASLLYGERNFSGRLPLTIPRAEADLPPFDNTSLQVEYGLLHGYSYLQASGRTPRFAFGYGLSYTSFGYEALRVQSDDDGFEVEVRVTNTGDREGADVVQIYVDPPAAGVERASRLLAGFARVDLAAGASENVRVRVAWDELARWDEDTRTWRVDTGDYRVVVGTDVETPRLEGVVVRR